MYAVELKDRDINGECNVLSRAQRQSVSAIFRVELKDIDINGECNVWSRAQRHRDQ